MYIVKVFPRNKGARFRFYIVIYFKMARGKELSVTKIRKIRFYKDTGKSERKIARLMKHFKTAINNNII